MRRSERSEVGVQAPGLLADNDQLAGLVRRRHQRHAQAAQELRKVGRMHGSQRRGSVRRRLGTGLRRQTLRDWPHIEESVTHDLYSISPSFRHSVAVENPNCF